MGDEAKDEKPDTINLKVVAQDGNEIFFKCGQPAAPCTGTHMGLRGADTPPRARRRCKKTTPLQKLMNAYCQRQGVSMAAVRFHFDGERLRESQTPGELDMEDGDAIDVSMEQVGGAARP